MALTGSFGGVQLAAALVQRVHAEASVGPAGRVGSAVPFPSPKGLGVSPGDVSCRVVALPTLAAQHSDCECTRGGEGQLLSSGAGNWH